MLERITPVILTLNEEPNIARVLERVRWARSVVVVDSYSTDRTVDMIKQFANVRVCQRKFDSHANQWNFAISETGIKTEWILALDADYVLTDEFVDELAQLQPEGNVSGYRAAFKYCVLGKPLRASLYPPVTMLYRKEGARYEQDGHTQRIFLPGRIGTLASPILHDDRKALSAWLQAQDRYMEMEAAIIRQASFAELSMADKVRKLVILAPFLTLVYCLIIKGCLLDGKAGLFYTLQRTIAELVLSLKLIQGPGNNNG